MIVGKLKMIAEAEGINVERAALESIARLANGGMRDSQSILDQMISFCGNEIAEADVLDVYGLASADRIADLARSIGSLNYPAILFAVDSFAEEGRDLFRILQDLQAHIRSALLDAIAHKGATDKLGTPLTTESIMRMLDALHQRRLRYKKGFPRRSISRSCC